MAKKNIDKELVRELTLFIENNGDIYRQRTQPFIRNFRRKIEKGKFNKGLAVKGLANNLVPEGVKKYNKLFGSKLKTTKTEKNRIARDILRGMGEGVCENVRRRKSCLRKFK